MTMMICPAPVGRVCSTFFWVAAEGRPGEAKASTEERYPIPEVAKEEEPEATAEEEEAEPVARKAKAAVTVEAV